MSPASQQTPQDLSTPGAPEILLVNGCEVDFQGLQVAGPKGRRRISYKAALVLAALREHAGTPVSRRHLLETVWPDSLPTDEVLSHAVTELRRALNDSARNSRVIQTIPRVGYRLRRDALDSGAAARGESKSESNQARPSLPHGARVLPASAASWLVLAGLLIGVAVMLLVKSSPSALPGAADQLPVALTYEPGIERSPTLSPDASQVAYVAQPNPYAATELMIRRRGEALPHRLTHTRGSELAPDFAPGGRALVFTRQPASAQGIHQIVQLNLDSGAEQVLTWTNLVSTVDYAPAGDRIVFSRFIADRGVVLHEFQLASGVESVVDYPRQPGDHDFNARYLNEAGDLVFRRGINPDGRVLRWTGGKLATIYRPAAAVTQLQWIEARRALLVGTVAAGRSEVVRVEADGRAAALTLGRDVSEAAAAGDQLAFVSWQARSQLFVRPLRSNASGLPAKALFPSTGSDYAPAVAGARLAFLSTRSGTEQVWLGDLQSGSLTQLSDVTSGSFSSVSWTRDRGAVVALRRDGEHSVLHRFELNGSSRVLLELPHMVSAAPLDNGWVVARENADLAAQRQLESNGTVLELAARYLRPGPLRQLYFFDPLAMRLARFTGRAGKAEQLNVPVSWENQQSWTIDGDDLYVATSVAGRSELWRYRLPDMHLAERMHLTLSPDIGGFSVAEDQFYYSVTTTADADILLSRL